MPSLAQRFIWQLSDWPKFTYDYVAIGDDLAAARRTQGILEGKAQALGITRDGPVAQAVMEDELISTAAIEGETFDRAAVRSSVMRGLGLVAQGPHDRNIDGLAQVLFDATQGCALALDHDRLCRWQSALFPGGTSGIRRIAVGRYRDHQAPMQIVSGLPNKEKVHFEAPPSRQVEAEMSRFLEWFAASGQRTASAAAPMDGLVRAALAHLWFETIHPFEDGNGRIGRAIVDMALAQEQVAATQSTSAPPPTTRLYSLSRQLLQSRSAYYDALNAAQCGSMDATAWVKWFVQQHSLACERASGVMDHAIEKARFWVTHAGASFNERQRKVLQRLLDDGDGGYLGGMTAEKYAKMTGTSKPSATRDLAQLVSTGAVWTNGQGKATRYYINVPGWSHGLE